MSDGAGRIPVQVNGEARSIPEGLSVEALLRHLDLEPLLVVVEHNGKILRRDGYREAAVGRDDVLEVVHFVGGGTDRRPPF